MEYDLKLSQQEIQVIAQGLGELPLKVSANVYHKIQQAVSQQDAEKAVPLQEVVGVES